MPETLPPRAVIELVSPVVDGGRFPAKATTDEPVTVLADVFVEGHDHVDASLWVRGPGDDDGGGWIEHPMRSLGNDRWTATFTPDRLGRWTYAITAWHDRFDTWRSGTAAKVDAGLDVTVELRDGASLLRAVAERAPRDARAVLEDAIATFERGAPGPWLRDDALHALVRRYASRDPEARSPEMPVQVEPPLARCSAWYELFPRSTVDGTTRHGTLADVIDRLDYVEDLGFDVLYLPPIHPIGRSFRKGANNTLEAGPDDVGSPWAIGAEEGGHTAVHPALGTVDDVRTLAAVARQRGIALALDIAFQCAPDHPWVREHPDWFRRRADGSIQYAENPPKKYQDIYPLDFESRDWQGLWQALLEVFRFWIDVGVTVFRVDNPHTKPFAFWEWVISTIHADRPDVIFLSEAFTRPRVMERLAKLGFSQSYTYFAWRQSRAELEEYFTDLSTRTVDFLRPNAWPNTPDILTEQLQQGGRPTFIARAVLAATLSANWGIYGPAFELLEHRPLHPGSEEYLDSEKYQLRSWNLDAPHSIAPVLRRLNQARKRHPALQHLRGLRFHRTDNDALLCYSKLDPSGRDAVLVVVNLDPVFPQAGWVDVDLAALGLPYESSYAVRDELGDGLWIWHGAYNWVRLDPQVMPAHLFSVEQVDR